jgi:MFS family permease
MAACFVVAVVFFQMSSTFGLHVTRLGFSPGTYGALISLNGALVVLIELPLTAITQRRNPRSVMALGYLLLGMGFAANVLGGSLPLLTGTMILFTVGEMICMPVTAAYIADLAPPQWRGRYMGLFGFTWSTALVCGPAFGLLLFERSPATLWLGCGSLGVLAAWIITRNPLGSAASLPIRPIESNVKDQEMPSL